MKKMRLIFTIAACIFVMGLLFAVCDNTPKAPPPGPKVPTGDIVAQYYSWLIVNNDPPVYNEEYTFFDNGEYYIYNYHNWKEYVQEEGTWTGSLESGGEIEMTVTWYRGTGLDYYDPPAAGLLQNPNSQYAYGRIGYADWPPPFTYTATVSSDRKIMNVARWSYVIFNLHGEWGVDEDGEPIWNYDEGWQSDGRTHEEYFLVELP